MRAPRCLVLGGSGYVGSEVCRLLAARGAGLAFTYFSGRQAAKRLEGDLPGVKALQAALTDPAAVREAVAAAAQGLGGLDALIHCAGTAGDPAFHAGKRSRGLGRLLSIGDAAFDEMMAVTVRSAFAAVQAAAPLMGPGSNVVIVGSMDGVKPVPAPPHDAAAKGALTALARSLALELGGRRILVNVVAPGLLQGGAGAAVGRELVEDYVKHSALGRAGTALDVARVVAWLAADNTYVNGQTLLLDGGL